MEIFAVSLCIFIGLASGNVVIRDAEKPKAQETKDEQADSSKTLAVSYSVMKYFISNLPSVLKDQILITDEAEKIVIENYAKSQSVPTEALDAYKSAKQEERALLKRLLTEVPIILRTYKTVRKGVAWNYTKLDDKFKTFFQQPSDALAQYEALKKDEVASLDSFLAESSQTGAQEGTKIPEAQEAEKRKTEEDEKEKAEKTEKEKNQEAPKAQVEESERKLKEAEKGKTEEDEKEKAEKAEKEKNQEAPKAQVEEAERKLLSQPEPATTNTEKKAEEKRKTLEETEKRTALEREKETTKVPQTQKNEEKKTSNESEEKPFCGKLELKINDEEKKELVKAHNDERRKEQASNMLKVEWNEEIAIIAQEKANTCGYFHSKYHDCNGLKIGQNLYATWENSGQVYRPTNYTYVTFGWAREREFWDYSSNTCQTGKVCGHWEILTSAETWQVGCGKAECPSMEVHGTVHKKATIVVCDYRPVPQMGFKHGDRCSDCGNSTLGLEEKGHICENELCVSCVPMKNAQCKCGAPFSCQHGGTYSTEICACKCPREYFGTYCERSCVCADADNIPCNTVVHLCKDDSYKLDLANKCEKTCNLCNLFPRPASCNAE